MGFTFAIDLTKFCQKAKGNSELIFKKICFDLFGRVIARTPVKTGRARANWQLGVNKLPTGTIESGFEKRKTGKKGGLEGGKWKAATGVAGKVAGEALKGMDTLTIKDAAYLANNVEYIGPLEYGTSQQAPRGMVRVTVAEFDAFVKMAAAKLR